MTRQDKCYLVEGNIDVISMYQSGVENTVASCGTSLTTEQIRLMRRYTKNVTVLYDGDNAGIKAALRAVDMLLEEGMHVRVVLFPADEDPDSYAQKYGSEKLQEYLKDNENNYVLFKTKVLKDDVKSDPIRKAQALKEIVHTISLVPDLMERTQYITLCSSEMHIPEQTLHHEVALELSRRLREGNKYKPDSNDRDLADTATPTDATAQQPGDVVQAEPQAKINTLVTGQAEYQERQIIRLLLNNGNDPMVIEEKNDDGSTSSVTYTVAQIIVGDILNDGLTFDNPTLQAIFDTYAASVDSGNVVFDTSPFIDHPDPAIRDMAIALMVDPWQISDNWKEKKHIYVPKPQDRLDSNVNESLLNFKLKKLDAKIDNIDRQFTYATSEDDKLTLVAEKMHYIKLRQQIGKELNRVVM